jgi:hypothetical protein
LTMRTTSSLKLASNFLRFFVINHSLNKSMIHLSRCLCKLNHYSRPPDLIVTGSSTVFIGKKPAARMGDTCAHGGSIVSGCPTVLIGD